MTQLQDKEKYIDYFSRIFVLAIDSKLHPMVITNTLSNSPLLKDIELNNYSELSNNSPAILFSHYFNIPVYDDISLFNYNNAYWCGSIYMSLFYKYRKPFSYIFLKLPLSKLLDMYPVYHEMDISGVYEIFESAMDNNSILTLLLEKHSMKLNELSNVTNVSINVLKKYKNNDSYIYKGSFNNLHRIALALNEPDNLFLEYLN